MHSPLSSTLGEHQFLRSGFFTWVPAFTPCIHIVRTNQHANHPKGSEEPEVVLVSQPVVSTASAAFSTDTVVSLVDRYIAYIRDLADPRLTLLESLAVSIEYFEGKACAYCSELDEFSVSDDGQDPLAEIKSTIVDLYFLLRDEQKNLGPILQAKWNTLRTIIREN